MALKHTLLNFDRFSHEKLVRCNYKTVSLDIEIEGFPLKESHRIKDLFSLKSGYAFESDDYVSNGIPLIRIGDLKDEIEVEGTVKVPEEFFYEYNNYALKYQDILVSLTGDGSMKLGLIKDNQEYLLNQRVAALRARENVNVSFYYYFLKSLIVRKQFLWGSNGKTQLNISPFDFLNIRVPQIPLITQDTVLQQILHIESNIKKIKEKLKPVSQIINEILARQFKFDVETVIKVDRNHNISVAFQDFHKRNHNLRFSYRWYQLQQVQNELYRNLNNICELGEFIIDTRNGWSPQCNETASTNIILGIDAINSDGKITLNNPKFTDETKDNIKDFIIREGDFFVSRGNTTDLVALASIAFLNDEEREYIFPDLMIKVDLDENNIDKQYLAYIFNSMIGRLYFKYAAKGKNQTMVKISAKELHDFLIPVPSIIEQRGIVSEINTELERHDELNRQIEAEKQRIYKIIENITR